MPCKVIDQIPFHIPHYRSLAAYFDGHGSGLSSWVWFNFVVRGWLSSWVFMVVWRVWLGFGGFVIWFRVVRVLICRDCGPVVVMVIVVVEDKFFMPHGFISFATRATSTLSWILEKSLLKPQKAHIYTKRRQSP